MITLRQTRTPIEADLLISRLRAAGLHPADLRVWPHVTLAGADLFFQVEVPADEVEPASQIIRSSESGDGLRAKGGLPSGALRIAIGIIIAAIAAGMLLP
jgi:hypothetical protein